jgi:mannose-6-phosphate isomerase-like protein (cupin superfamily)
MPARIGLVDSVRYWLSRQSPLAPTLGRRLHNLPRSWHGLTREAAVPNEPVTRGYVVGPGEGVSDQGPEVKASGRSTGGSLTLIELAIDDGPPRHTHTREDESFYVLTGTLEVECGNDRFQAGPGSFVFLPRNLPHVFRSMGGPATALLIVSPGGLDEYFAELSAALAANADAAQVRSIQQAYGIARS